jgi:hypothetical protein
MSEIKTKDAVEILEYVLENRVMSSNEALTLRVCIKRLNEHDALVAEVERLEVYATGLKEDMFYWKERAGKGESEVERLRERNDLLQNYFFHLEGNFEIAHNRAEFDS